MDLKNKYKTNGQKSVSLIFYSDFFSGTVWNVYPLDSGNNAEKSTSIGSLDSVSLVTGFVGVCVIPAFITTFSCFF